MKQFIIGFAVIVVSLIIASMIGYFTNQVQAQTGQKIFEKNSCQDVLDLLSRDDLLYNNGDPVSSSISGCEVSVVAVEDWDNITTADKLQISNLLSVEGYTDITNSTLQSQSR